MEKYDVVFVDGLESDFVKAKASDERIIAIHNKITFLATQGRLTSVAPPLKNTEYKIRKLRVGKDYRLFLFVKNYTVYCLASLHRRECYKKKSIKKIVRMIKSIEG